jgi:hypothetical protein
MVIFLLKMFAMVAESRLSLVMPGRLKMMATPES